MLHRSIFELLLSRAGHGDPLKPGKGLLEKDGPVSQLMENWRMNDVLTSYAAALIYGPGYTPVSKEVANRRLKLKPDPTASDLVAACLDPAYPMVLVSIAGAAAAKENAVEAGLVADLVLALRERLLDDNGKPYADDGTFFRDGLFIVSPHHTQIGMIRSQLAQRRKWSAPPFVDTVDKMQGQEADAVLVSYGVSDTEYALMEAEFIYGLNRLNVAVTRARSKCIVCLPAPLLEGTPAVLDIPAAEKGLAYMRRLAAGIEAGGEVVVFDLGDGVTARVMRTASMHKQ